MKRIFTFIFQAGIVAEKMPVSGFHYGFFGVLAPVLVVTLDDIEALSDKLYSKINRQTVSLFMFSLGLLLITMFENVLSCQIWSLCAVLLLMLYNGNRGKYSLKYGFYLFYPLHLLVLQIFVLFIDGGKYVL